GPTSPAPTLPTDPFPPRGTANSTSNAGTHTSTARADDGIRLYIDGTLVIDAWIDQPPTTYTTTRTLTSGTHQIKLEYYENTGGAVAKLDWAASGGQNVDLGFATNPTGLNLTVTATTPVT